MSELEEVTEQPAVEADAPEASEPTETMPQEDQALHDMMQKLKDRHEDAEAGTAEEVAPEAEEEQSAVEESSEDAEAEKPPTKVLTGKAGEKEVELPSDTQFVHKVDGQEVEVSLQELLNNYSGKVAYDRKFQELDTQSKEFEQQRSHLQSNIDNFYNLASGGKTLEALDLLLESSGLDRNAFMRQFADQVEPQLMEYMNMTPEEREVQAIKAENEYFKRKHESENQRLEQEQSAKALEARVREIQEVRGLEDTKLAELYQHIVSDQKLIDGQSPEKVLDILDAYAADVTDFERTQKILSEVDKELAGSNDTVWEFVDMVRAVSKSSNTKLSDEDLLEVAQTVYGTEAVAQELSNKVRKTKPRAATSKPEEKSSRYEEWLAQLKEWKS